MNALDNFVNFLCGEFDNSEQLQDLKSKGIEDYPYARHINYVCNDKMLNVDKEVNGKFLILESYYTINGRTRELPHFFLITQDNFETIKCLAFIPQIFFQKIQSCESNNKCRKKNPKDYNPPKVPWHSFESKEP